MCSRFVEGGCHNRTKDDVDDDDEMSRRGYSDSDSNYQYQILESRNHSVLSLLLHRYLMLQLCTGEVLSSSILPSIISNDPPHLLSLSLFLKDIHIIGEGSQKAVSYLNCPKYYLPYNTNVRLMSYDCANTCALLIYE